MLLLVAVVGVVVIVVVAAVVVTVATSNRQLIARDFILRYQISLFTFQELFVQCGGLSGPNRCQSQR